MICPKCGAEYLSAREVASRAGVSRQAISFAVVRGRISSVTIGARRYFVRAVVDAWLAARRVKR